MSDKPIMIFTHQLYRGVRRGVRCGQQHDLGEITCW
jgi:hypothetical protein